ncbi:HvfC/BufC family peptide modification chaperone [Cupriavidus sp. M-11]|uniref:HvfC/BufC family peptide modification chaperone n=1 Tax=Cupriavidus sp. M-11 TaxID=3233038 RepID=UPI003F92EB7F
MNLAELQRDFRAWLVTASPDAARRLEPGGEAGVAVYQNNYRAQLVGCLESSFPLVHEWMGEDLFLAAAIAHIDLHPPHAWTLDAYADGFGQTLAAQYPDNPDLHELAWIEHALSQAFVSRDAAPLAMASMADVDWDTAHLRLAPSLAVRVATTNAERIWTALSEGESPPEGEMLAAPAGLIVWRRQFTCYLRQVDAIERDALISLQASGSFAALCTHLVERLGDSEGIARAGALLAGWLGSDLIASIEAD